MGTNGTYSRLLGWEVYNFMAIEHAKAEFDECNIINFKGYNDSGKSAMLRALDVLLFNIKPSAQTGFIQDGKDYFRVVAYFDDDVIILRDKYINGQGLYEMYKGAELIFSTKRNGLLVKIQSVPQPIQDYLGVIQYDNIILNSRSCFEKQLLVQTTGSENEKFCNATLRSEELAVAGQAINTDKNALLAENNNLELRLVAFKDTIRDAEGIYAETVEKLKSWDEKIDVISERSIITEQIKSAMKNLAELPIIPDVPSINSAKLDAISKLANLTDELLDLPIIPEVPMKDSSRLDLASKFIDIAKRLEEPVIPEMTCIDSSKLNTLISMKSMSDNLTEVQDECSQIDGMLANAEQQKGELARTLQENGVKFVKCQNCGELVEADEHTAVM